MIQMSAGREDRDEIIITLCCLTFQCWIVYNRYTSGIEIAVIRVLPKSAYRDPRT